MNYSFLHACAAGPVDDDRLSRLVYIVLHAKVGRYPVDQHTVVGRHVRELLKGTERVRKMRGGGAMRGKKCRKEGKRNVREEGERGREGETRGTKKDMDSDWLLFLA